MSSGFWVLGLLVGLLGAALFVLLPGVGAIQGGILLIVGALFMTAGAVLDRLDRLSTDVGEAAAEAVKALLAGVKDQ